VCVPPPTYQPVSLLCVHLGRLAVGHTPAPQHRHLADKHGLKLKLKLWVEDAIGAGENDDDGGDDGDGDGDDGDDDGEGACLGWHSP
jgi:hypothetical protein